MIVPYRKKETIAILQASSKDDPSQEKLIYLQNDYILTLALKYINSTPKNSSTISKQGEIPYVIVDWMI
jgi:hypothetical protein